jgi:acetyl-CoA C-acetyltransferase
MTDAWIIDAVRTPRGRGKPGAGALSGVHPQELVAQTLNELARRQPFEKADVADVVIGCVSEVKEQGACIARNSVMAAGWPDIVTGVTLNRFCGSGLQGVNFAAMGVKSGEQDLVIGGGVESMSRVPMGSDGGAIDGHNLKLRERVFQVPQGISADLIATLDGVTREEVDRFALESQQKAARAIAEGRLKSLFPVVDDSGKVVLDKDEHPRASTTLEKLGTLEPSFATMGAMAVGPHGETLDQIAEARYPQAKPLRHVHHAGNSSGIVDGAALVLLASDRYAKAHGLKPRARIRATATAGAEPVIMLNAPTPASERALAKAGMTVKDIDIWEINEAFAVVPLNTIRRLEIDPGRVNVNGGSIAYGHPLGATGAALLGTALDELERSGLSTALITLCIGGGMGIATIVERV